jgi:hypothetical protein
MKRILLISLAFMIALAAGAQKFQLKNGIFLRNYKMAQKITKEPFQTNSISPFKSKHYGLKIGDNTSNIVTVLNLGTSANILGYSGGSRTMVWADPDLNVVINIHRMGPGTNPASLSGYLGMDLGLNMGATQADWTNQIQVLAATMAASPYYYDASRYPSAGIYNPDGNTDLANAYLGYFAPNFANMVVSGFGGYSYGVDNLVNHADSTKHLRWYHPAPYTYIPDGYTISNRQGLAHMADIDANVESGSVVYQDSVIYGRGVWNATTHDFDYTFKTLAFPCVSMNSCADVKIAASPDGRYLWMSALTDLVGATPLIAGTYFPVLRMSTDSGKTWSAPKAIQLDGPNGIAAVKNQYSDYFIQNVFVGPPYPTRDEIPYTTAFEHGLSVDKWGNPHIAVAIGTPGSTPYSISTGIDSLINVFDIYSVDKGATFQGVFLGALATLRGIWTSAGGDIASDNRVYISSTKDGDKMFITYNDTRITGVTDNLNPDVYARGFDLINNMITSDAGVDQPNDVTFLSDIMQEAYMQCASPYVFTDNGKYTIPICTQWWADPTLDASFKYIPDFSYLDADFTVPVINPGFQVGIDQKNNELASVTVYPNPVKDIAKVSVNLKQSANVSVELTNLVGQQVMSLNKGNMNAGTQQFSIDASSLTAGVYFITVKVNGQKYTQKLIVE